MARSEHAATIPPKEILRRAIALEGRAVAAVDELEQHVDELVRSYDDHRSLSRLLYRLQRATLILRAAIWATVAISVVSALLGRADFEVLVWLIVGAIYALRDRPWDIASRAVQFHAGPDLEQDRTSQR